MRTNKCFISYAHADREMVQEHILPILEDLNLDVWYDEHRLNLGDNIFEYIIKTIREADLIITYFNGRSSFVNFEIGSAIGYNKPVIAILNDKYKYQEDIRSLNYIYYNESQNEKFRYDLKRTILRTQENVIDKLDSVLYPQKKIIGIEVGVNSKNYQEELRITADLINFLEDISGKSEFDIVQTSSGSLKSILSLDLKSWAELVEKIIFFIPELKRRKSERLRIDAETRKIDAETNDIKSETRIKQAQAFLDIMERSKKLGLKFQLDNDLLFINEDNVLKIKDPSEPQNNL